MNTNESTHSYSEMSERRHKSMCEVSILGKKIMNMVTINIYI
jgi:hypothetical protein